MRTRHGSIDTTYTKSGKPTYSLEMWHDGLNKHRLIKSQDLSIVENKALIQAAEWESRWSVVSERKAAAAHKQDRKAQALEETAFAQEELRGLEELLAATLSVDDSVDWELLKDRRPFPEAEPSMVALLKGPEEPTPRAGPNPQDPKYIPRFSALDYLLPARRQKKRDQVAELLLSDTKNWREREEAKKRHYEEARKQHARKVEQARREYEQGLAGWTERRAEFLRVQEEQNRAIDERKRQYLERSEDAVIEYCDLVLSRSIYPDTFPQECEIGFDPGNGELIVDYQLPAPEDLPRIKGVRYVASRDALEEQHITQAEAKRLFG